MQGVSDLTIVGDLAYMGTTHGKADVADVIAIDLSPLGSVSKVHPTPNPYPHPHPAPTVAS